MRGIQFNLYLLLFYSHNVFQSEPYIQIIEKLQEGITDLYKILLKIYGEPTQRRRDGLSGLGDFKMEGNMLQATENVVISQIQ
jgi:hypothetical protein